MRITILGGAGFLGRKLAARLAKDGALAGRAITGLTLFDLAAPATLAAPFPVTCLGGDVADPAAVAAATPPEARQLTAGGWRDTASFWAQPLLAGRQVAADALRQPDTRDRFVAYRMTTNIDGVTLAQAGLIDAGTRPAKLLLRRWGDEA
jgi:nucleoside-diphosphate-sugar epimerase